MEYSLLKKIQIKKSVFDQKNPFLTKKIHFWPKKSVSDQINPYFPKNLYKNPYLFSELRKSVHVQINPYVWQHCMQKKQYAQAMFMYIQGAFDSTTFAAIQEVLERRNVGKTMVKWIANMLKCRNMDLTYQISSAEVEVVKSCPQGVTSTVLMVYGGWQPASVTKC